MPPTIRGGRFASESVADLDWNRWPIYIGMGGRIGSEYTDWTGRAVHPKKKGSIPEKLPMLLTRLGLSQENWIETVTSYEKHFSDYVGQEARMRDVGVSRGMKWLRGLRACRRLFSTFNSKANTIGALVVE